MAVLPGLMAPTFRDVAGVVHPLSVYTPRFTAFIVPFRGTVWFALRTAAVVTVRASPVIASATIAMGGIFVSFMWFGPYFNVGRRKY